MNNLIKQIDDYITCETCSTDLDNIHMAEAIAEMCRKVAVEAAMSQRNEFQKGGMAEFGIECAIEAINKAFNVQGE